MRMDAAAKREEIEQKERDAEMMRSMPVDDSKIVEQMFGFLPEGEQGQVGDEGELAHDQLQFPNESFLNLISAFPIVYRPQFSGTSFSRYKLGKEVLS